ncbi:hypothetical protein F4677DRAFT_436792 [Hypoxylon crocopeplum]|nr:hypothetical protein F4677DRAFT_436792 [Hypoxylon crocopeplum]
MSEPKLPLELQAEIRDQWDRADSPVEATRILVSTFLGVDIQVNPSWSRLSTVMSDFHSNTSQCVSSIEECAQTFLTALFVFANSGGKAELTRPRYLELAIGASIPRRNDVLTLSWSCTRERDRFHIIVSPGPMPSRAEMLSLFQAQIPSCYNMQQTPIEPLLSRAIAKASDRSDMAPRTPVVTKPGYDVLPDARTLPQPEDLLLKPPYHLAVYGGGKTMVEVQCSHSLTLEVLADYLKKWCKTNHQDTRRPPAVEVSLHQSSFGFSPSFDRLTMSVEGRNPNFLVSPMIVLSLVEGVLGYKSVSVDGSVWIFRKDVEFKKSGQ